MIGADTIDDDSIDFGDVTGVDITLTDCGAITSTGTITATVGFDIVGAADIDYGSADVTDHSFTTDDCTFIIDGGITVSTGDVITLGAVQWNSADEIDGTKIKDADYGDVDVSAGGAWTLDTDSVADNEIDYANVTFADFDYETNWKMWHSDGAGDVTEITLGANGTFLESNGAAAAPAFRALADGDVPDTITIDLAATATALAADPSDCASFLFAATIAADGTLTCRAIVDGDVPIRTYFPNIEGRVLSWKLFTRFDISQPTLHR